MTAWTTMTKGQKVDAVKDGLAGGMTFAEIGRFYGTTRNAPIGVAHRAGIEVPKKPAREKSPKVPREKAAKAPKTEKAEVVPRVADPAPAPVTPIRRPSLRTVFVDRRPFQCAYLDDERAPDGSRTCCGRPSRDRDSPWCAFHQTIVYRRAS